MKGKIDEYSDLDEDQHNAYLEEKKKGKKERKPRKERKRRPKEVGAPKRPMSAYMLWLNVSRERIRAENPGISITEISKKAGEMWRTLSKEDKGEWDIKAVELRRRMLVGRGPLWGPVLRGGGL
ncbi:FACT complex subunit SSRP1-like [Trematomus bernacchii]|uniref:FACT complex subunit SSRP1-like n=1 Tax=Trematomus bernacchii TaxID=40690 RepID=UPI00146C901C|nr:FACT complex subunit SSRP1-like [Trematomus bernacchii]